MDNPPQTVEDRVRTLREEFEAQLPEKIARLTDAIYTWLRGPLDVQTLGHPPPHGAQPGRIERHLRVRCRQPGRARAVEQELKSHRRRMGAPLGRATGEDPGQGRRACRRRLAEKGPPLSAIARPRANCATGPARAGGEPPRVSVGTSRESCPGRRGPVGPLRLQGADARRSRGARDHRSRRSAGSHHPGRRHTRGRGACAGGAGRDPARTPGAHTRCVRLVGRRSPGETAGGEGRRLRVPHEAGRRGRAGRSARHADHEGRARAVPRPRRG